MHITYYTKKKEEVAFTGNETKMRTINAWLANCSAKMMVKGQAVQARLQEKKGDIPISTLGGILLSVFGVVISMAALQQFMPGIFKTIFTNLQNKITALWSIADGAAPAA